MYTDEFLERKRQTGDLPADMFVQEEFANTDKKIALRTQLDKLAFNYDLRPLKAAYPNHHVLAMATGLPDWADKKLMAVGAGFFVKHSQNILLLLGLLSLPYCYTAGNGAMVLYQSDRLRNDTARRLQDTAMFIWEVMAPDAFAPMGKGFVAILKIRLIHAAARYYTLKSGNWQPEWGLPVNQEDMAGTNLSFSLLVIRGLRKLGLAVDEPEQRGFLHLWNVIGTLLGVHQDLLPDEVKSAALLEKSIRTRQFMISAHGRALTRSLLDYILKANPEQVAPAEITGLMRYLLGNAIADMLDVPGHALPSYKVELMQLSTAAKSIKPLRNVAQQYRADYHQFKMQQKAK